VGDAAVIEQHIDAAELVCHRIHPHLHRLTIRDIDGKEGRTAILALSNLVTLGLVYVAHHDRSTLRYELWAAARPMPAAPPVMRLAFPSRRFDSLMRCAPLVKRFSDLWACTIYS
jgi:hypothetical protein